MHEDTHDDHRHDDEDSTVEQNGAGHWHRALDVNERLDVPALQSETDHCGVVTDKPEGVSPGLFLVCNHSLPCPRHGDTAEIGRLLNLATTRTLDPVEKLRRMTEAIPGHDGTFYLQRLDSGLWNAGLGLAYSRTFEAHDQEAVDDAIDLVARRVIDMCATRLNVIRHEEEPALRNTLKALERLGYR